GRRASGTCHSARHSGPAGPPPGTRNVGEQFRVESRHWSLQVSVPPVNPSASHVRPPKSVPSHSSLPLIAPLPQAEHLLTSRWHWSQPSVPVAKPAHAHV